jgi:colanic acid biosynthesis glycosyl transferase WcaI
VRVCFFNRSYWPDQAATGQLLTELAQDLVRDYGCSVSVVAGPALHASERSNISLWPVTREEHQGVRILRANGTRLPRGKFVGRAANYLTYFASAFAATLQIGPQDVIVSLTDPPILGLAARSAARRAGARFVFLCEDIFPEVASLLEDFHNTTVNRTLDRINKRLVRDADAVVALGDRMKRRLVEEKGAAADRVHVIHNWADCQAIEPGSKDNAFSRAHGLHDKFVVMHSGNVGLSQNLDLLVEAAARLQSRERLVIAIVGDGARRGPLQQMARQRGLANLRFFPYQPKELLHESFATADAFVVSLKRGLEGYIVPSKLYGILAAGRPFVAAVDPSCEPATIATSEECGIVAPPGDLDALVGAMAALHDDPARTRRLGENARRAAWRYDRRAAVRAYHELFAGLSRPTTASTAA